MRKCHSDLSTLCLFMDNYMDIFDYFLQWFLKLWFGCVHFMQFILWAKTSSVHFSFTFTFYRIANNSRNMNFHYKLSSNKPKQRESRSKIQEIKILGFGWKLCDKRLPLMDKPSEKDLTKIHEWLNARCAFHSHSSTSINCVLFGKQPNTFNSYTARITLSRMEWEW